MSAEDQLKRINDKLQQLLKQYGVILKENIRLREELELSKSEARSQKESMDQLRQQVDVLKLSSGELAEADKKELEKRINSYLKEIDRCIALLGE